MSRTSTLPTAYTTFGELERGFLHQLRRFKHAAAEIAALNRPIVLSAPGMDVPRAPREPIDSSEHQNLELLRSQTILLQNMSAQILTNFPGDPRAEQLRKRVDDLCKVIQGKSEELRTTLGKTARKQVDRTVVTRNHLLMEALKKSLAKRVENITEMYLVGNVMLPGMRGEGVMADVAYLRLTDLKGPDGFVHPSYYLMTAHPTQPGSGRLMPMYLSAGPTFLTPGRIKWTTSAKNPGELVKIANDLLIGEGVISNAIQRDLPLPPNNIKFVHDNVKKTTIIGNEIRVLVKDKSQIDETRGALRRQLSGLVRQVDPRNRDVIRDRVDAYKGTITLTFSLPGNLRGRVVDPDILRKLGIALDLDPAAMQRVRTAIENPE